MKKSKCKYKELTEQEKQGLLREAYQHDGADLDVAIDSVKVLALDNHIDKTLRTVFGYTDDSDVEFDFEGGNKAIAEALEKLVVSLEKPDCTVEIDLVKVKEEMEKREFKYDEENLDGWTNCLVEATY